MNNFKEFPDKMQCPCGSGKIYKDCCKKKKFKYELNNNTLRKVIPMHKKLVPILREIEVRFKEYYGRKCSKNDHVFAFAPVYNEETLLEAVYRFRKAGIPEKKIYAYYKSDGLLPSELNLDYFAEEDIKEFQLLCDEFNKLFYSKNKKPNIIQYVMTTNAVIEDQINYVTEALICSFNDFIQRHTNDKKSLEYHMSSELDYCIFSALKTLKIMHSILKLKENHLTECIYALSRGIFENYMYICNIIKDDSLFKLKMSPKVDEINYTFDNHPDGSINFNKVINKKTGEKTTIKVNVSDLVKNLPYDTDKELYTVFYQTACQYVHVDIMSAKSYYSLLDPYDEVDRSLIACLISSVLVELLLLQISLHKNTDKRFKNDVFYLCNNNLNIRLINCLILANSDPEHKNAILELLVKRIENQFPGSVNHP